jgi:DNA end-binding protein Ku
MRWADEVRAADGLKLPEGADLQDRELQLASTLIDQMTGPFDPAKYHDDYREKLRAIIDEKVRGAEPAPRGEAPTPTKVVDLMKVLQQSLASRGGKAPPGEAPEAANGHGAKGSRRRKAS